jgi:hypothetical protein
MKPTRPFLSYERRDAAGLADRLRIDLEKLGYEVWQDTREIRAAREWEERIPRLLGDSESAVRFYRSALNKTLLLETDVIHADGESKVASMAQVVSKKYSSSDTLTAEAICANVEPQDFSKCPTTLLHSKAS